MKYLRFDSLSFIILMVIALECASSQLQKEVLEKPDTCVKEATSGMQVSVHYTGTLTDGKKFDSSLDRGQPFSFTLGAHQVIAGWEQGVVGMCVGEKRKLIIPPDLGYGDKGAGDVIPPGATLVFEIELLDVREAPVPANIFKAIDKDADTQISREELSGYLHEQMAGQAGEEAESKMAEEHDKLVEEIFAHEDKDKDGFISHEEFSGPKHDEL